MSKTLSPELIEFFHQFSQTKDIKDELGLRFETFIANPEKYGASAEQAKKISEASADEKESIKKAFVKALVKQFKTMNTKQEAQAVMQDLKDGYNSDISKSVFKEMLKNPGDPKFQLELETIQRISGMDKDKKADLLKALYEENDLKTDALEEFGEKFKEFFGSFVEKFAPIFMIFSKALIGIGTKKLVKVIDNDIADKDLKEALGDVVTETGSALKETITETHSTLKEDKTSTHKRNKSEVKITKQMEELKLAHHENSAHPVHEEEVNISGALNASVAVDHS